MATVRAAADPLELHWAIAAIDAERRAAALAVADAARARGAAGAAVASADDLAEVELLAGAYDLAARDRLEQLRSPPPGRDVEVLEAQLADGAAHALALYAALPLPDDAAALWQRALHLRALAEVAGARAEWTRWMAVHEAALPGQDAGAAWDVALLGRLVRLWDDLLQRSGPGELEAVMESIATIREERPAREQRLLARLDADARVAARFYLFALYHAVDAATELMLFLRHGAPADIARRLALRFSLAREATAGDFALDVLFTWLYAAAMRVVRRRTAQLEIPGLAG